MMSDGRASAAASGGAERTLQVGVHAFNLAQGIKDIGLPLLLVLESGQADSVGVALAVQQIPNLVLSPFAGLLVDRVDRRLLLWSVTASRIILAILLALIAVTGLSLFAVCVVLFLLGVGDAVYDVALISLTVDVVADERLPVLNGRFVSSEILFTRVVGAVIGGALFSVLGVGVFVLAAGVWLASAIAFFRLPRLFVARRVTGATVRLRDGFMLIWSDPVLRGLAFGSFVLNLSVSAWWVLIPLASVHEHGLAAAAYGLVMAGVGLCGVTASWTAHRLDRLLPPLILLVVSVLMVALGGFIMGVAEQITAFIVGLVVFTVADTTWTVLSATERQRRIPPERLGVGNGVYRSIGRGASPLGALLAGLLAQEHGLSRSFVGSGVLLCAAGLSLAVFWGGKRWTCGLG